MTQLKRLSQNFSVEVERPNKSVKYDDNNKTAQFFQWSKDLNRHFSNENIYKWSIDTQKKMFNIISQ